MGISKIFKMRDSFHKALPPFSDTMSSMRLSQSFMWSCLPRLAPKALVLVPSERDKEKGCEGFCFGFVLVF